MDKPSYDLLLRIAYDSGAAKLMAAVTAHAGPPRLSLVKESTFLPSLLSVEKLANT